MKVITIPIEKNKEIGDLVKCENRYTIHNPNDMCNQGDVWQPHQLLIVEENAEVLQGEYCYNSYRKEILMYVGVAESSNKNIHHKIIASYLPLKGTEKISKETVAKWIQAGCPKEVEVEYDINYYNDHNQISTLSSSCIPPNRYPIYNLKHDSNGFIICNFGSKETSKESLQVDKLTGIKLKAKDQDMIDAAMLIIGRTNYRLNRIKMSKFNINDKAIVTGKTKYGGFETPYWVPEINDKVKIVSELITNEFRNLHYYKVSNGINTAYVLTKHLKKDE